MAGSWRKSAALVAAIALVAALAAPSMSVAATAAKHAPAKGLAPTTAVFAPDAYEPDDTTATAHVYNPAVDGNSWTSMRTVHGSGSTIEDPADYVAISVAETGTPIWAETEYVAGYYDSYLYLYDADGNELASDDDHDYWSDTYSSCLYYVTPAPGTYYLAAEPIDTSYYPYSYKLHITVGDARRIYGADRFATAVAASKLQWDNTTNPWYGPGYGPGAIVVANGLNPADALAGGAFAAQMDGVLLLTRPDSLPSVTRDEINRLSESLFWDYDDVKVYILGGTGAVSKAVEDEIAGLKYVTEVERLAGADRYRTAVAIADETVSEASFNNTVFLVNGTAWPDALAASTVAPWDYAPVLMSKATTVPAETPQWLEDNGVTDVVIVGGEGVISAGVEADLTDLGYNVERVAGANRYETAEKLAEYGVDNYGMNPYLATLVTGENPADALSAASIGWWTGAPVLLTPKDSLSPWVETYFDAAGGIGEPYDGTQGIGCYVLGGPGAISASTYGQFRDLWKQYVSD